MMPLIQNRSIYGLSSVNNCPQFITKKSYVGQNWPMLIILERTDFFKFWVNFQGYYPMCDFDKLGGVDSLNSILKRLLK